MITSNFFAMLGIHPALGRVIEVGKGDAPKTGPVPVLGYSYWKKRFGGDPGVTTRSGAVDGNAVTIIGVVPEEFHEHPTEQLPMLFDNAFMPQRPRLTANLPRSPSLSKRHSSFRHPVLFPTALECVRPGCL